MIPDLWSIEPPVSLSILPVYAQIDACSLVERSINTNIFTFAIIFYSDSTFYDFKLQIVDLHRKNLTTSKDVKTTAPPSGGEKTKSVEQES